jgi:hypothetical protein
VEKLIIRLMNYFPPTNQIFIFILDTMAGFTENSRLSNERMIGNNVKLFEALKGIIAVNGGKRVWNRVSNCSDEQAPIP